MANVGVAVADALMAAHEVGILHRDVKPGNVLLDRRGRVKLGDFGIARLLSGQSATTTDVIAFTPEHVAPELLRRRTGRPVQRRVRLGIDPRGHADRQVAVAGGTDERVEALMSRKVMSPRPALPGSVPPSWVGRYGAPWIPNPPASRR